MQGSEAAVLVEDRPSLSEALQECAIRLWVIISMQEYSLPATCNAYLAEMATVICWATTSEERTFVYHQVTSCESEESQNRRFLATHQEPRERQVLSRLASVVEASPPK